MPVNTLNTTLRATYQVDDITGRRRTKFKVCATCGGMSRSAPLASCHNCQTSRQLHQKARERTIVLVENPEKASNLDIFIIENDIFSTEVYADAFGLDIRDMIRMSDTIK